MTDWKFDLEDRLVKFAGDTILFTRSFPGSSEGKYFVDQLVRASSSAALNFGEAQGTKTNKDFSDKLTIVLREIKECRVAFKILDYLNIGDNGERARLIDESEQLSAIFYSIQNKSDN